MIDKLTSNPKQLFLIDGLGAVLTIFFLVVILAGFEDRFGMPQNILYGLSLVVCVYAIYSFSCYFFLRGKWRPYLKAIAMANLLYCLITIGLVFYFYQSLTILGLLYFFLEVVVIGGLVVIEWRVVTNSIITNNAGTIPDELKGEINEK